MNSWYFLLQFSLIFGLFFNLRKKKIKNGFTTFFLYTFLHSFLLLFCPEFTFPFLLSFSLVRFLASDLRNPFNLRNTLLFPFFSPLTFSSLLCASLLRYLSSSHPLDAVHPPSSPFPSPFVSHPLLELYSRHPNPICYQPSLISLPLNNVNPRNFGISIDLSAIENCHCVFY